ncbi:hypothetical protein CASFOL_031605 [Castilleja foliolosa]|uniref:Uncharacterized protein n=1 Tax=Castilleja foliolosa TaxID=1961234 RepID=A0ABD3C5U7_9LAMI
MAAAIVRATSSVTRVRFEAPTTTTGAPAPQNLNPPAAATPLLSISSKPSWVVKSESNVRKERITKPDPPCVVCRGSGRVDCSDCNGRGRTIHIQLTMLPKGEWPKCADVVVEVVSGIAIDVLKRENIDI